MNILEEIAGKTRERIDQEKGKVSVAELKERIQDREQNPAILPTPSFYQTLKKEGMSYIGEESISVKRTDRTGFSVCGDRKRI